MGQVNNHTQCSSWGNGNRTSYYSSGKSFYFIDLIRSTCRVRVRDHVTFSVIIFHVLIRDSLENRGKIYSDVYFVPKCVSKIVTSFLYISERFYNN